MTDETKINNNAPTYFAYQVQNQEGKSAYWRRVGSAWQHRDGKGCSISLDAVPLDGRITLRLASEMKN